MFKKLLFEFHICTKRTLITTENEYRFYTFVTHFKNNEKDFSFAIVCFGFLADAQQCYGLQ